MSNRVANTPKIEPKELFLQVQEGEVFYLNIFLKAIGHQLKYLKKIT